MTAAKALARRLARTVLRRCQVGLPLFDQSGRAVGPARTRLRRHADFFTLWELEVVATMDHRAVVGALTVEPALEPLGLEAPLRLSALARRTSGSSRLGR
jgi:hypothetical protein